MGWGDIYKNNKTGELIKHFPAHAGQLEVLQSKARYVAAIGGVNSGKTVLGCLWLANEIANRGGQNQYLVVGPKYDVVTTSTMNAWETTVRGTALEGKAVHGTTNPYYDLGTGGRVYFRSANASFEGLKPYAALFDEAGDCAIATFHAIQRRLAGRSGRICIATTPYPNHDWLENEFIARADSGDSSFFYRTFASTLNPTFDPSDLEEAKKTLEPWEVEMFYYGRFSKPPGQVYNLMDYEGKSVAVDYKLDDLKLEECSGIYGGIDWGGADPTAILVAALYPDRSLTVFRESYLVGQDIGHVIDTMAGLDKQLEKVCGKRVNFWFCDHSPTNIISLSKAGWRGRIMPVRKGPESIPVGISLVKARFRSGALRIVRGQCPNLLRELAICRYPCVNGKPVGNKPMPGNDHALDSLSYLTRGIDRQKFDQLCKNFNRQDRDNLHTTTDIERWQ